MPLVVIFGRTNVGKSTLFNCLTEKKQALTADVEGTTRDSNLGKVSWQYREFELVDTGGIIDLKFLTGQNKKTDDIESKVQLQAKNLLKQADLVIFTVDAKAGLLPQDKQMALLVKKIVAPEKIILLTNKSDNTKLRQKANEFYQLGLGEPIAASAANGSGTGDLLDEAIARLFKGEKPTGEKTDQDNEPMPLEEKPIKICLVGKPNVGKSSLINSILGYQRVIVSPVPHTTREPQNTRIAYQNQPLTLIDTAGISRKGTKTKGLEKYGIEKSLAAIKKSDLAFLVLDVSQTIDHQDVNLAKEIIEAKKSLLIIANKWDLVQEKNTKKFTDYIHGKIPFVRFAPIQFVSALTKSKIDKVLALVPQIMAAKKIRLTDSQLDKFLNKIVKLHRPAKGKGAKYPRIYEIKQLETDYPAFALRIGSKEDLHFSYVRFVENRLREQFGFLGSPITINVTKGRNAHGSHNR